MKEPEGLLKKFAEIYNDSQIIAHVNNKSLRAKLERLRAEMGVDFYNIDREPENFEKFASKYMLDSKPIKLHDKDGTVRTLSFSMAEVNTGLMLGYDQESEEYKGYNTFKSIVDKMMNSDRLNEEELSHVNTHYRGRVDQKPTNTGKWILISSFYFGTSGVIYRAIYDFVIQLSMGRIQVKRCNAPLPYKPGECKRLFLPYRPDQRFCSTACRMRTYRKGKKLAVVE